MQGFIFNIQKFSLHDGPGIRTSVFFQGCNMRCKWCANPESFDINKKCADDEVREYRIEDLVNELKKDKVFYDSTGGGVTLTGGEPLLQSGFASVLCDTLRLEGIDVWLETAANVSEDVFLEVAKKCQAVYIDIKHYDEKMHRYGTDVGMELIHLNIRNSIESNIRTIVRIPVVPKFNDSIEDFEKFGFLLKTLKVQEVQLLPFHQMGSHKYEKLEIEYEYKDALSLHEEDLEPLAELLRMAVSSVQVGG